MLLTPPAACLKRSLFQLPHPSRSESTAVENEVFMLSYYTHAASCQLPLIAVRRRIQPLCCIELQDNPYTPSTHTSLESPCNGRITGVFTPGYVLLQEEPSMYNVKMWDLWHQFCRFITPDTHIILLYYYIII
jgi:hypothetical protein